MIQQPNPNTTSSSKHPSPQPPTSGSDASNKTHIKPENINEEVVNQDYEQSSDDAESNPNNNTSTASTDATHAKDTADEERNVIEKSNEGTAEALGNLTGDRIDGAIEQMDEKLDDVDKDLKPDDA